MNYDRITDVRDLSIGERLYLNIRGTAVPVVVIEIRPVGSDFPHLDDPVRASYQEVVVQTTNTNVLVNDRITIGGRVGSWMKHSLSREPMYPHPISSNVSWILAIDEDEYWIPQAIFEVYADAKRAVEILSDHCDEIGYLIVPVAREPLKIPRPKNGDRLMSIDGDGVFSAITAERMEPYEYGAESHRSIIAEFFPENNPAVAWVADETTQE